MFKQARSYATRHAKPTHAPIHVIVSTHHRLRASRDSTRLRLTIMMHPYNLDCPICTNSFKFEHIRSLPCGKSQGRISVDLTAFTLCHSVGHTYCSSCVDKLIDDSPTGTCPECRQGFVFLEVRRLFINPSTTSGSQPASTGGGPQAEEGFIRQANHIAKRLRKINGKSSAQSVQIAADVIEDVATVQCKEAQARLLVFYVSHTLLTLL